MRRPHMKLGVGMLTSTYFESITDLKKLKELEYELTFRSTPRAAKLLDMVRKSIQQIAAKDDLGVIAHQPDLVSDPEPLSNNKSAPSEAPRPTPGVAPHSGPDVEQIRPLVPRVVPDAMSSPDPTAVASRAAEKKLHAPSSSSILSKGRPIGDSYKFFHASAETPWETIETTRRKLIERSNPIHLKEARPEEQQRIIDEAKQVNAAYAALSMARCARR